MVAIHEGAPGALQAVLWYARRLGWRLLPLTWAKDELCSCGRPDCHSPAKHPRIKRGVKNASSDQGQLRRWWAKWPMANVGLACGRASGVLALDVDGAAGEEALEQLAEELGAELPPTIEQRTAKGRHLLYRMPDVDIRNKVRLAPDLDVRSTGGYIVIAPSVHASGAAYRWVDGHRPNEREAAELPSAWVERLKAPEKPKRERTRKPPSNLGGSTAWGQRRLEANCDDVTKAPDGARNDALNTAAYKVGQGVAAGEIDEETAREALAEAAAQAGLGEAEVRKTIQSGLRSGFDSPKGPPLLPGQTDPPAAPSSCEEPPSERMRHPYIATSIGLMMEVSGDETEEPKKVPLCNFVACILADVIEDDAIETHRSFELEGIVEGRKVEPFRVKAADFASLRWVGEELGARAVVRAGPKMKEHVRAAIQLLSSPKQSHVYTHIGWREVEEGRWAFLHGDGAIGVDSELEVDLPPPLAQFRLPKPPEGEELIRAIRESIFMLDVAPLTITVPVFAAVWRAVLGGARFSIHVEGASGTGKTEVAALAQRFFGAAMDANNLPASWVSTGNALETIASAAKDAILVVDDFAPTGSINDIQRLHREAERILRAQGNLAGRYRLRADASLRDARVPRGLLLSTGEDVPGGVSLRARQVIVSVRKGDIDWRRLSIAQQAASSGLFASAMSGFIAWLAPRAGNLSALVAQLEREERLSIEAEHQRTATNVAGLRVALRAFLRYAEAAGALTPEEADTLAGDWWSAVSEVCEAQALEIETADPAKRFMVLIRSALLAGEAHLATTKGFEPEHAEALGWRSNGHGMQPQGARVGWIDGDEVYLDPAIALSVANKVGAGGDGRVSVTQKTLGKRLDEQGILARRRPSHVTVQKRIDNARRTAFCISTRHFLPERRGLR